MNIESRIRAAKRIAGLALATAAAGALLLPAAQASAETGQVAGAAVVMHEKPVLCKHRHKCKHGHKCHKCGHHRHHCKCGHRHHHHHDKWDKDRWEDKYKDDHHKEYDHKKNWYDGHHHHKHHNHNDKWWLWPDLGNGDPWWGSDENNQGQARDWQNR